ncbi:MAG: hypothetical protein NTW87_20505 [Planctomycetota bacterium]|nr:hypothetical protein [Planctomycetota bacterium]
MNPTSIEQTLVALLVLSAGLAAVSADAAEPESKPEEIQIGSRLELFVDRYLIDKLEGAALRMHVPQPLPLSAAPIKGYYMTVIKDGDLYRAYYRGYDIEYKGDKRDGNPGEITCYAESSDGHNWKYPQLGLYRVNGPEGGNVILAGAAPCSHNFSPFLDTRPGVPAGERFKALAGVHSGGGLIAFVSGDGVRWKKLAEEPVIKSGGFAFDSQNTAFWSQSENCYVCCYRSWETPHGKLRTVSRTTSDDFLHWSAATPMNPNLPGEHLYTSNTHPYFRAPHIYIALPTRFHPDRGDSTDIMLMTSRGGSRYDRPFLEAFIRPGLDPQRWGNRANYAALNVVPTGPAEMSIYHAPGGCRYVLRTDGFASVNAGHAGGEMLTRPFAFSGKELVLNYSTSAAGSIRVEIQSPDGKAVAGFSLSDCKPIVGDRIEGVVAWLQGGDVSSLSGKRVRLRFALNDADLYAMRFR